MYNCYDDRYILQVLFVNTMANTTSQHHGKYNLSTPWQIQPLNTMANTTSQHHGKYNLSTPWQIQPLINVIVSYVCTYIRMKEKKAWFKLMQYMCSERWPLTVSGSLNAVKSKSSRITKVQPRHGY